MSYITVAKDPPTAFEALVSRFHDEWIGRVVCMRTSISTLSWALRAVTALATVATHQCAWPGMRLYGFSDDISAIRPSGIARKVVSGGGADSVSTA